MCAAFLVQAVKLLDVIGFVVEIDRLGRGDLHPVGQFETFNARIQFVVAVLFEMLAVESGHQVKLRALSGWTCRRGVRDCQWARPWAEVSSLINAGEKPRPSLRITLGSPSLADQP